MSGAKSRILCLKVDSDAEKEDLCRVVAAQVQGTAFWYEPGKGCRFLSKDLLDLLVLEAEDGICPAVWKGRALGPKSSRKLKRLFAEMSPKRPEGKLAFSVKGKRRTRWLEVKYSWIADGAVLSARDITEVRDSYLVSQDCFRHVGLDTWDGLFRCVADITEDLVVSWVIRGEVPARRPREESYSRTLALMSRRYVAPRDQERFMAVLSPIGLMDRDRQGRTPVEAWFQCVDGSGMPQRLRVRVDLVRERYSGNVCARLFASAEKNGDTPNKDGRDGLTGTYDRQAFVDRLAQRLRDRHSGGALVLARVNHLDRVNDILGARQGDQLLREISRTLSATLREGELLGRYSGAEFLLYLTQMSSQELLEERLRILCTVLGRTLDKGVEISVDLGVVDRPETAPSMEDLHDRARLALRAARQSGESQFVFYSPELRERYRSAEPVLTAPAAKKDRRIFVRTFGYFDVFVNGAPVHFQGGQAKELMALLVDRRGGILSSAEAIAYLWEDEPANKTTFARFRKVAMRLKQSLEEAGIGDILECKNGERRVVPEKFRCDYYEFLATGVRGSRVPPNAYMTNYSWAETTLANLE